MLVSLICILEVAFWLLAIGKFVETNALTVAGGYLGVIVAFMAWCMFSSRPLLRSSTDIFVNRRRCRRSPHPRDVLLHPPRRRPLQARLSHPQSKSRERKGVLYTSVSVLHLGLYVTIILR
jgi:hypothetical protein